MQITLPGRVYLATFPFKFLDILGPERLEVYEKMGYHREMVLDYFQRRGSHGHDTNFWGAELTAELLRILRATGAHCELEVPVSNTSVDVLAFIERNKFYADVVQADMTTQRQEIHGEQAFECKASVTLPNKVVRQIKGYTTRYNSHVYTLASTEIQPSINASIRNKGADIVRGELTRQQIINRVLGLQKQIKG